MRIRWFVFSAGILFLSVAYLLADMESALIAFTIGMAGGFIADTMGVHHLKWWRYPRQPFSGMRYFLTVIPCWGIFGMTLNLLWDWTILPMWIAFLLLTLVLLILHEIPNLKTRSWEYYIPSWFVVLGWFPMILAFRLAFIAAR